jgi:pyrroloquinoline quinone biosynthesis protein D
MTTVPDQPRLSRLFRMQWEQAQGIYVLLYPEGMVKLNSSAAEILKRCDGQHSAAAIAGELERVFGAVGLQDDVDDFLQAASARGWIG